MRFVILETVNAETDRHEGAEALPFIAGLLSDRGWDVQWWALLVPRQAMHAGGLYVVDLPTESRVPVERLLGDTNPDIVLYNNRLVDAVLEALQAQAPSAKFVDLSKIVIEATTPISFVLSMIGVDDERALPDSDEPLADAARPAYVRRWLVPPPRGTRMPPLPLLFKHFCQWRRPLRSNPYYQGLTADSVLSHRGCAFCNAANDPPREERRLRTPPVEAALRQIMAHQQASPDVTGGFEYNVHSGRICHGMKRFFSEVLATGARPSTFYLLPRADEILAQEGDLEELLPRLQAAGHRVALVMTGAENFSLEENERFNKGITPEQAWRCTSVLRDLATRFPHALICQPGEFAGILFTPWTKPDDLRMNIEASRRLGPGWLRRSMGVRLVLRDGAPMTELARRDGLLCDAFEGAADVIPVCLHGPEDFEVSWKFADRRTERLLRLLIRLDPVAWPARLQHDDPDVDELRRHRARLPRSLAEDYAAVALGVVDAVATLGPDATIPEVFARIEANARASSPTVRSRPILVVEFARQDEPQRGDAAILPFLVGALESQGQPCVRARYVVSNTDRPGGGPEVELDDDDLAGLLELCGRLTPTAVVLTTTLAPSQREALARRIPDARWLQGADDPSWVEIEGPRWDNRCPPLYDTLPDYRWIPGNAAARSLATIDVVVPASHPNNSGDDDALRRAAIRASLDLQFSAMEEQLPRTGEPCSIRLDVASSTTLGDALDLWRAHGLSDRTRLVLTAPDTLLVQSESALRSALLNVQGKGAIHVRRRSVASFEDGVDPVSAATRDHDAQPRGVPVLVPEATPPTVTLRSGTAPNAPAPDPAADHPVVVRLAFQDRASGVVAYVFRLEPTTPGKRSFVTVGDTSIVHDACRVDAGFKSCAGATVATVRRASPPLRREDHPRWLALLSEQLLRTPEGHRFVASIERVVRKGPES